MKLPRTVKIRQNFKTRTITDIPGVIHSKLGNFEAWKIISPGQSVAVTAGSRGIVDIADILAALVRALKGIGAKPFIVPAMGSHGGATAQGQVALLARYGITEEFMGVPIKSSMDRCWWTKSLPGRITLWWSTASSPTPISRGRSGAGS
jgi:hypothetical protein